MGTKPPNELSRLLDAADERSRLAAWEVFVQKHSRLMMHAVRSLGGGYDAAMDRYAYVLDRLRADDFKRLRSYSAVASTKFTTWLVVVTRRISTDYHRSRYGRVRGSDNPGHVKEDTRKVRRRLADLLTADIDLNLISDERMLDPEHQVVHDEVFRGLDEALSRLPARDRLLLALRYEDVAPAREIADLMAFPSQFHVYRQLKKVLDDLRKTLEARGIDDAGD
jgi:RNA polymerase sigma factor (sigma-70 family)